jgi:class 3 adenylate cyclase
MGLKNDLYGLLLKLIDPILLVNPKVRTRILQKSFSGVKTAFLTNCTLWPILYIAHYFFNDHAKQPLSLYFKYRFGMAAAISLIGVSGLFLKQNERAIKILLIFLDTLMCYVQIWSMTLGPYISHSYLIWLPAIVLASFARSFILAGGWLVFLVLTSRPFWISHTEIRFIFSDTVIALAVLMGVIVTRWVWIESAAIQFESDDLRAKTFESQEIFNKQIRSFISPVLIHSLERAVKQGSSIVAALDSVLRLRKSEVCVLFSDIRNFSLRSDDVSFIENELIPSARMIIDEAESNNGIAKQIGDAVLIYYNQKDPEESLLLGLKDALRCCIQENARILSLGRLSSERFFTITYGLAYVGNMASTRHREATIIGSPANLAARIDTLTKENAFKALFEAESGIFLADAAFKTLSTFTAEWSFRSIDLSSINLSIRSFPNETHVYYMPANDNNIGLLNRLLEMNQIPALQVRLQGVNHG